MMMKKKKKGGGRLTCSGSDDGGGQRGASGGGCGRKKEEEDNLQGERTGGCCGWTVAVLASCGGDGGLKADGDDSGGLDGGERECEETDGRKEKILGRKAGFLAVFGPKFLHPLSMKIKSIYRLWKRDTLSLMVQNLNPWFDPKASQPLAQSSNDELSVLQEKWLVRLATLGRCHHLCNLDQPERLTLACSQVSQDRLCVRFIQFGEETRRQMCVRFNLHP
jgi:hypothetical protein